MDDMKHELEKDSMIISITDKYVTYKTENYIRHVGRDGKFLKQRFRELIEIWDDLYDGEYFYPNINDEDEYTIHHNKVDAIVRYLVREKQFEEIRKNKKGEEYTKKYTAEWIPKKPVIIRELAQMQLRYAVDTIIDKKIYKLRDIAKLLRTLQHIKFNESDVLSLAHWKQGVEADSKFINPTKVKHHKFFEGNPSYINLQEQVSNLNLSERVTGRGITTLLTTLFHTSRACKSILKQFMKTILCMPE